MNSNPFAAYFVEIPNKYRESVLKYCRSGGNKNTPEFAPFERQVDFWFMAFLFAINRSLEPVKEEDTYNATPASIFSTDPERINLIQLCVISLENEVGLLREPRKIFDKCQGLVNAGIPYLLQILQDPDDRPLWALMEELDDMSS